MLPPSEADYTLKQPKRVKRRKKEVPGEAKNWFGVFSSKADFVFPPFGPKADRCLACMAQVPNSPEKNINVST